MQPVQANKAHRHRRSSRRPREVSRFFNARAKSWPEGATKTRQYDLLRPRVGQKEPPRLGSTICYGQELARKSHRDSAVRFVTAKRGPERATQTRQYDLLRPNVGQKEPPRPRQYDLLRPRVVQKEPPRLGSTICYGQTWARKSHQDSAVRLVTAKSCPERATKTRQYDLLRPRVGQKEPPRLGSTICYGQTWARKSPRDSARPPPPHTQPICRAYPQPTLEPRPCPRRPCEGRKFVGKVGNSWARSEIRGQGRKCREIRGQGREFVGKVGKFAGKVGNSWARSDLAHEFPDLKFVGKRSEIRGQGREIRGQGRAGPCPRI